MARGAPESNRLIPCWVAPEYESAFERRFKWPMPLEKHAADDSVPEIAPATHSVTEPASGGL